MAEITCPVARAAKKHPSALALIDSHRSLSYRQYHRYVGVTAHRLKDAGISSGERVGILLPNDINFPILFMALLRIGAVACPINRRFPHDMVAAYLKKIDARLLVLPEGGERDTFPSVSVVSLEKLVDLSVEVNAKDDPTTLTLEQDATIIATSGSSAIPKAVLHTFGNHYYSALGSNENISLSVGDRWLVSLPLYHVGGLGILFRTVLGGAAAVFPDEDIDICEAVERFSVTHLSLVGTQLSRLIRNNPDRRCIASLAAVLVGGGAIPKALIREAYDAGLPLYTTYGSTEMSSQVTATRPGDSLERLYTSGKLLPYRQLAITAEGEILVKGETLFGGYVENEKVILPLDEEGWFHTGDMGELDDDGYLTVLGRKDNMFISGGENMYPEEIEQVLMQVEGIRYALVLPVENAEFGFRPLALVLPEPSSNVTKRRLVAFLERRLPRFKIPVKFYLLDEHELAGSLKPSRSRLKERLRNGHFKEIE